MTAMTAPTPTFSEVNYTNGYEFTEGSGYALRRLSCTPTKPCATPW